MKIIKRLFVFLLILATGTVLFGYYQIRYNGTYGRFDGSLRYLKYDEKNDKLIFFGFLDYQLDGIDGPIVKHSDGDSLEISYVIKTPAGTYEIEKSLVQQHDSLEILVKINNEDRDEFSVNLNAVTDYNPVVYTRPEELLALSDIEGNFNALYSLLTTNKVMTTDYEWNFGKGHVVCNGDIVDRGDDVLGCLWLLYHLQNQAKKAGGRLHFVLGNHELWNLQSYPKSAPERLIAFAQSYSPKEEKPVAAFRILMNENNLLTEWMLKQPVMVKIGDILFVHGGISSEFATKDWSVEEVNNLFWRSIDGSVQNKDTELLYDDKLGPLWNRTMIRSYGGNDKLSHEDYTAILNKYGVSKIVLGHSIVDDVSTDYDGSLYRIDVQHSKEKYSKESQGLLFRKDTSYRINAAGEEILLNDN